MYGILRYIHLHLGHFYGYPAVVLINCFSTHCMMESQASVFNIKDQVEQDPGVAINQDLNPTQFCDDPFHLMSDPPKKVLAGI